MGEIHETNFTQPAPIVSELGARISIEMAYRKAVIGKKDRLVRQGQCVREVREAIEVDLALFGLGRAQREGRECVRFILRADLGPGLAFWAGAGRSGRLRRELAARRLRSARPVRSSRG